jgi:hypothetical protein
LDPIEPAADAPAHRVRRVREVDHGELRGLGTGDEDQAFVDRQVAAEVIRSTHRQRLHPDAELRELPRQRRV